jgi:putative transposase
LDLGAAWPAAAAGAPVQLEAGLDGAVLCYGPAGGGWQLAFQVQPGSYDTDTLIVVLSELSLRDAQKATLLWDGLPAHRSTRMQVFLASRRECLVAERLPAYAPELNPVERLCSNLKGKGGELSNLTYANLAGVIAQAHPGVERVRLTPQLACSFLRHAVLSVA